MPLNEQLINPSTELGINELLTRGIAEIIPAREVLEAALKSGKKLTVYLGIDPTGPQLHLGHSAPLLLLGRFQKLGHKTILLIGDFTARIGDPSGRTSLRKPLALKEIRENLKTYKEQASKIINFLGKNATVIKFNSKWHNKLKFGDLLKASSSFTVQQMLARDMFQERIKKELPISLNEFLYPIAQGYDSVALKTDIEIGASDQLFNMLVGREMVSEYINKEKFVVTIKLLVNPVTGAKMSKSEGSFVALADAPNDMYGKIMAFPDELIRDCFELCTDMPMTEVEYAVKLLPRDAKAKLARTLVTMYHDRQAADKAEEEFNKTFAGHGVPTDMLEVHIAAKSKNIVDLLVETGLASSKSEARRLVGQGGVRIDGEVIKDQNKEINLRNEMVVQVGRRRFVKITA